MENKKIRNTKIIAFIGTVLIWIPILFTLVTAVAGSIAMRKFLFDYLMPAELFPLALIGGILLLWASKRSKFLFKPFLAFLITMFCSLAASQGAAVLTGLASGKIEAKGWQLYLVMTLLVIYIAAVIAHCILGIILLKNLKQKENMQALKN